MSVTIEKIMTLPSLRRARVLAGKSCMDRIISAYWSGRETEKRLAINGYVRYNDPIGRQPTAGLRAQDGWR